MEILRAFSNHQNGHAGTHFRICFSICSVLAHLGLSFRISHNFRSSCHIFPPYLKKNKTHLSKLLAVHTRKPRAVLELCDNGALLWCVVISVTRRPVILDSKENNVRYFILWFHLPAFAKVISWSCICD